MSQVEQLELQVEKRTVIGKQVKQLRRQGIIPAVLYGPRIESVPIQADARELRRILMQSGMNRLIALKIDGESKPRMALVREVQRDPVTREVLHVDFYEVVMTEKVRADVALVLVGESPAVEQGKGVLLHGISTVEIECLPGDLIQSIEVDISGLAEIDQAIFVKDLVVPEAVQVLTDGDELVVKVEPVTLAEEEEEEEMVVPAEVEVIAKGKMAKEAIERIEEAAEEEEVGEEEGEGEE